MLLLFDKVFGQGPKCGHRLPAGLRVYAVGDIHGRADLLAVLQRMITRDAADSPAESHLVVYLGDYLDRGAAVRDTVDALRHGLAASMPTVHLRGNHEQLFSDFLTDPTSLARWLSLGGTATLLSYGVRPPLVSEYCPEAAQEVRHALLEALPASHLRFLTAGLRPMLQLGDYVFVHAGLRPGVALARQREEDLLWIRDEFLVAGCGPLRVVHGHTIYPAPAEHPHRIGVDTGAYATGVLSCAVLEDDRVRFLATGNPGGRG